MTCGEKRAKTKRWHVPDKNGVEWIPNCRDYLREREMVKDVRQDLGPAGHPEDRRR